MVPTAKRRKLLVFFSPKPLRSQVLSVIQSTTSSGSTTSFLVHGGPFFLSFIQGIFPPPLCVSHCRIPCTDENWISHDVHLVRMFKWPNTTFVYDFLKTKRVKVKILFYSLSPLVVFLSIYPATIFVCVHSIFGFSLSPQHPSGVCGPLIWNVKVSPSLPRVLCSVHNKRPTFFFYIYNSLVISCFWSFIRMFFPIGADINNHQKKISVGFVFIDFLFIYFLSFSFVVVVVVPQELPKISARSSRESASATKPSKPGLKHSPGKNKIK